MGGEVRRLKRTEPTLGAVVVPRIPGFEVGEWMYSSRLRSIYRGVRLSDGAPVVLKTLKAEYPSRHEIAELRREFRIAKALGDSDCVVEVHSIEPWGHGNLALCMAPFGRSLDELLRTRDREPLPIPRFLRIAIQLARALGEVHQRGVVHKDIVPRNVLIDEEHDEIKLIDFGISSELDRERQSVNIARRLEGSLPYLSPEQTGRINRVVDYRSDYYALGVTFFELLTGRLPFEADTALEWVHTHISKLPPAPSDLLPSVPQALSGIVLKLMAKDAEDRYQSSFGLVTDLERCRDELERSGSVAPFPLGSRDVSARLQIPQRLYGRQAELDELTGLFERVAGGKNVLCLVSGHSGVGKSMLVNEISRPLIRERGYLTQGKFDQFQRGTAYAAVAAAFRGLMNQLLAEPPDRLDRWRSALQEALAPNGQVLVDLIPELELVIGEQPAVPELPPTEAQNRFQIVFMSFVKVLATAEHPLVVFLDDLQWSDAPTLNLIQRLVTAREITHLFLIGAYRSNEVDAGHSLRLMLNDVEKTHSVHELSLRPLDPKSVGQLVADTLRHPAERCAPVSSLLFERTEGNPFYINELLRTLHDEEAIAFDIASGHWSWDMGRVQRAATSVNVVELVVANLRKLPEQTQEVLQLAACIGAQLDLRTLSIIHASTPDATATALQAALTHHALVPLSGSYLLVGADRGAEPGAEALDADEVNPRYAFQHDRVQQAAYALIDSERKQEVHLSIGRLMLEATDEDTLEERLIDVVGHLNEARALIDDGRERVELARLNLQAGIKAQRSSAVRPALEYLGVGIGLLPESPWETEYELTKALWTEYQQCAYLTADYEESEARIEMMLEQVRSDLERAELLSARTRQYSTVGKMQESIDAAIRGLALLGMEVTANPSQAVIDAEIAAVPKNLAGRRIEDLIDAPRVEDRATLIAIRLLMEIFPAAFLSGSGNLFPFLVLRSVNLTLTHGNSPESAFAYAAYGMLLCGALNDPATALHYGRLAVAMNERFEDVALKSRVIYVYAMFIHHWSNHWSTMTPWFRKGIEAGYQSGDLLYLAYSAQDCIIWDPTLDLETASREQRKYLTIVRDCEYQDSYDSGTLFLQTQLNYQGLTDGLLSMNDEIFDEERTVEGMRERGFMTGVANYQIYKAEICCFYGEYDEALRHVRLQDPMIASSMSLPQLVRYYIVAFLVLASVYDELDPEEQAETMARLRRDHDQMARWAETCADNFLHLQLLMEAELAVLEGEGIEAIALYEKAIEAASHSGFLRDAGVANERAAQCLLQDGYMRAAEGYVRAALGIYERWGAKRKVEHLRLQFPRIAGISASQDTTAQGFTTTESTKYDSGSLDMASVMKASQAISGEIVLEQLLRRTIGLLLENAGGRTGCFVLRRDGRLVIEAHGSVGDDAHAETERQPVDPSSPLPISMIRHVMRTRRPVVLHDAANRGEYVDDPYVRRARPQSVICVPILGTGQLEGVIYMENNLSTGVFTEERIEVLKLLTAQAAISIENANLYDEQLRLTEAQSRFVPRQFLESLDKHDIAQVGLGEYVSKDMSVMFSDLRRFTTISEILGARETIDLLNSYFKALEPSIVDVGGFIDSFAGDEIMALFDTGVDDAVRAGIAMCRALEDFNGKLPEHLPELKAGIGVNTGHLFLGTVGGGERIQCTVIGDTVNLASRIEQLTKVYRGRFLVGGRTVESLGADHPFSLRFIDLVAVQGKSEPAKIYQVLDAETPERKAALEASRGRLAEALDAYYARDFETCLRMCEEAAVADPHDAVPELFAERSRELIVSPPPADWNGTKVMQHK